MELVMEWVETFAAVDMGWMYFDFKKEINLGGNGRKKNIMHWIVFSQNS